MREEIRQFFVKEGVAAGRIVVAVSGGTDSTALLLALHELGLDVVAAHIHHQLRGADSDADEAFVRDLCTRLGVRLRVADGTLDADRVRARGIEAAAREVRYARLAAIREEEGARWVATAHQKNDQAETVLMRLLAGSGVAGLRGIHPVREDGFIRPLLDVTRAAIEAFLTERNVVPRFDHSNADPRFLRNRVRAFLGELDAADNLAQIAADARAQWPLLERAIDEAERNCVILGDDATHFLRLPGDVWLRGALLQRHIRRLDPHARDFDASRIAAELESVQRRSVTKSLELLRRGETLILRKRVAPTPPFELALQSDDSVYIEPIGVTVHLRPPAADERRQLIELPAGAAPVFTVRNRRDGDRFQPLGMPRPKKLKDFLIDRKIDRELRDRLPLLVWNGEIVWVAGVEVSERFKVRDAGGVRCAVWTS
ncbi:MAG TPA: tRNA lysidine(34) synthetase TilS [Thermoanaerobaculia bacterium]|jgi:tRNA(Ile)-lysidine synthase|nr:tRNA lysidine(34) synthetase TilS [Thermoanaerobaculia bacterium]